MRHDTTGHAVPDWAGIRVFRVNLKDNPVGALIASANFITAVKNGELVQLLAVALGVEFQLLVIAESLWVAP